MPGSDAGGGWRWASWPGCRCWRRGKPAGGGVAALYLSIFSASSFYQLIPKEAGFVLTLAVTAAGVALAVLQDAVAVAILSIVGGFITPVLFSTGTDRAEVLFVYLTVLNLGVLGAALHRRWRALDVLAYAGTMLLYSGWFFSFYRAERMGVALAGLLGFFLLFLLIPALPILRRRATAAPEAVILPAVAGMATFAFAYRILFAQHKTALAFLTLLLSAGYVALGAWVKRRVPDNRRLISGHLVLSVAFLTLAIPIQLGLHGITLAWAVEGPVLIYLGFRTREPLVRLGGLAALGFAAGRVLIRHLPLHDALFRPVFNRPFGTVLFVVLAFAISAWTWRRYREEPATMRIPSVLTVFAGLLLVGLLALEGRAWCHFAGIAYQEPLAYQLAWRAWHRSLFGLAALIFVVAALRAKEPLGRMAGAGLFLLAAVAALRGSWSHWTAGSPGAALEMGTLFFNRAFLSSVFVAACMVAGGRAYRAHPSKEAWDDGMSVVLSGAALLELWLLLTVEVYGYFSSRGIAGGVHVPQSGWLAQTAVTVTWTLYAIALLVGGFAFSRPALRYSAFALFGLSVAKVLMVDMSEIRQIYRVVSLVALGLVLVGVSYLYSRSSRRSGEGRP